MIVRKRSRGPECREEVLTVPQAWDAGARTREALRDPCSSSLGSSRSRASLPGGKWGLGSPSLAARARAPLSRAGTLGVPPAARLLMHPFLPRAPSFAPGKRTRARGTAGGGTEYGSASPFPLEAPTFLGRADKYQRCVRGSGGQGAER